MDAITRAIQGRNGERRMTIEYAILCIKGIKSLGHDICTKATQEDFQKCLDMAIHSLEMQKKLAEYSGMDICEYVEDYDYDENDISEYEYETSVDDFLIDEVKDEKDELSAYNRRNENHK